MGQTFLSIISEQKLEWSLGQGRVGGQSVGGALQAKGQQVPRARAALYRVLRKQ